MNEPDNLYPDDSVTALLRHNIEHNFYKPKRLAIPSEDYALRWLEKNNALLLKERRYDAWDAMVERMKP